jgi:hypothetical protein
VFRIPILPIFEHSLYMLKQWDAKQEHYFIANYSQEIYNPNQLSPVCCG